MRFLAPENRPDHSSVLVGDRDDGAVEAAAFAQLINPAALRVRLSRRSSDHGSSAVNDERAQVLVATFADPKELGTITTGVLPRNKAKPRRHVTPVLEIAPVADGSDDSRGYLRSHALDPGDSLSQGARSKDFIDPAVEYRDTAVDLPQEVKELGDGRASADRQSVLGVLQDLGNCAAKLADVPGKDQSAVSQKAPDLTGESRTVVHESLSRAMECLDILLLCRPTGHKAHIGLLQRCADRLCVVGVVLLAKPEGLHVLRTDDPNGVSEPFKSFRPEVRTGRGLDPDDARLDLSD
jgi:hypothetical protein